MTRRGLAAVEPPTLPAATLAIGWTEVGPTTLAAAALTAPPLGCEGVASFGSLRTDLTHRPLG